MRYSTKYWRRLKGADVDQVEPDVTIPLEPVDIMAARDPVMEHVLNVK